MAYPDANLPRLPDEYMAEATSQLSRRWEDVLNDAYRLGFSKGEAAAVARILKAAQPNANSAPSKPAKTIKTTRTPKVSQEPGAETHRLIETVLRTMVKATPTAIAASPANKTGIARDALRNAMRRGRPSGRYVSLGKGLWALGRAEAQK